MNPLDIPALVAAMEQFDCTLDHRPYALEFERDVVVPFEYRTGPRVWVRGWDLGDEAITRVFLHSEETVLMDMDRRPPFTLHDPILLVLQCQGDFWRILKELEDELYPKLVVPKPRHSSFFAQRDILTGIILQEKQPRIDKEWWRTALFLNSYTPRFEALEGLWRDAGQFRDNVVVLCPWGDEQGNVKLERRGGRLPGGRL